MELSKEKIEKAVKAYMDLTGFSDLSSDDMGRRTLGVVAVLNLAQADHEAELQAQRAVLAGPVTDDEWSNDLYVFRTVGRDGALDRTDINALLAARAAKLDKKPEPTLREELCKYLDAEIGLNLRPHMMNGIMEIIEERGRKAVQP